MVRKRVVILGAAFALCWVGMLARVFHVQVVRSEHYKAIADNQSTRRLVVPPKRGEILDRDYSKLVMNASIELPIRNGEASESNSFKLKRVCPKGFLAGQVLGNVGRDGYGLLGLEYSLDKELRGTDGWSYARFDAFRNRYPAFQVRSREPVDGHNVVLTLDSRIQSMAETALERGVKLSGAKQGVVVVVDPWTGDVMAMANYPFYDPNRREGVEKGIWKNQAVGMVYEPGSTFKMITAAALIEEGLVSPKDSLDAEGGAWRLFGHVIRDAKAHGFITMADAMAYSSNIYFAKAVGRLRPETFYRYARSFGFGIVTGVGLPAEESGFLKPVAQWSGRTQATMAFGHEISATPLQVAMAFAAVANGGTLMKPRIVKEWVDADGKVIRSNPSRSVRRVMSEETAAKIRELLHGVVDYGTASNIRSDRIAMAGKTGTAEKIDQQTGAYLRNSFNSSFAGMFPAENPAFACLVLLDEPSIHRHGGTAAAPIFREIVERLHAHPSGYLMAAVKPRANNDSAAVPDLSGQPLREALKRATKLTAKARISGDGDMVVGQFPPAGTRMGPRDTLVLQAGVVQTPQMPDLSGLSLRDALLRLRHYGLEVEFEGSGTVLRQEPKAGTEVHPGRKCKLTLAWGGAA